MNIKNLKILDRPNGKHLSQHLQEVFGNAKKILEGGYSKLAEYLSNKSYEDIEYLLKIVSLLHDIGKSTKEWQSNMGKYPHSLFSAQIVYEIKDFLDISTDLFPVILRVIAEHHSAWYIKRRNVSLVERKYDKFDGFTFHFVYDERLQNFFIRELNIDLEDLIDDEITIDLFSLYEEIEKVEKSDEIKLYSFLLGILKEADYKAVSPPKYKDEYPYSDFRLNLDLNPLQQKVKNVNKNNLALFIQAPTGIGKTEASLVYASKFERRRLFYTIPISFAINVMRERLQRYFPKVLVDIHHHWSHIFRTLGGYDDIFESSIFSKRLFNAVNIISPDILILSLMKSGDWSPRLLSMANSTIIFDECHLYDPVFFWFIIYSAKKLYELFRDVNFVFMSATAPQFFRNVLSQELVDIKIMEEYDLYDVNRDQFNKGVLKRGKFPTFKGFIKEKDIIDIALKEAQNKKKVLIVKNSVAEAQNLYKEFSNKGERDNTSFDILIDSENKIELKIDYIKVEKIPVLLVHRRFAFGDRFGREKLINLWNKENSGCIVISTQIVEVSLDIDFDVLITDIAPIPAIVQRLGRIDRGRNREGTKFYIIEKNLKPNYWKPYRKEEIDISRKIIEDFLVDKIGKEIMDSFWLEIVRNYYEDLKGRFVVNVGNKFYPPEEIKNKLEIFRLSFPERPLYLSWEDKNVLKIFHETVGLEELLFADLYKEEIENLKNKMERAREVGNEREAFKYFSLLGAFAVPVPYFFIKMKSLDLEELKYIPYDKEVGIKNIDEEFETL